MIVSACVHLRKESQNYQLVILRQMLFKFYLNIHGEIKSFAFHFAGQQRNAYSPG